MNFFRSLFRRDPPSLRNRAGGMATVLSHGDQDGAAQLVGRVVTTVRLMDDNGFWLIDPPQRYVLTAPAVDCRGAIGYPGDSVRIEAMHDSVLRPWSDPDWTAEDESHRYLPPVPRRQVQGVV